MFFFLYHTHLYANSAWAGQFFLWFQFGAFVVHRVSCAAHRRLACWFVLQKENDRNLSVMLMSRSFL